MFFQSWNDFFYMGGYGFYVWLSYGISLVVILGLVVQSVNAKKQLFKKLAYEKQRQQRIKAAASKGEI